MADPGRPSPTGWWRFVTTGIGAATGRRHRRYIVVLAVVSAVLTAVAVAGAAARWLGAAPPVLFGAVLVAWLAVYLIGHRMFVTAGRGRRPRRAPTAGARVDETACRRPG